MTDHRVTDVSHGHLGEATYDPDEHIWIFTKQNSLEKHFQPIRETRSCLSPALRISDNNKLRTKNPVQPQLQWLKNNQLQAVSAWSIVKQEVLEDQVVLRKAGDGQNAVASSLLAYGPAANLSARNRPQNILAMATGEGGHVLRLVKPQISTFGWKAHSGVNLKIAEAEKGEEGYWVGNSGTIDQITFANAIEGPSSWMAVRQPCAVTIFRPLYRQNAVPASIPRDYPERYPSSRLQANPVVTLPIWRTGDSQHVDVSFNPWYVQQIAVLDQHGHWSIWDIEGFAKQRRNTFELKAYQDGFVLDDFIPQPGFLLPDSGDGWGRVMWSGGVNTLVACNRRHIAVFDVKSSPKRLHSPDLFKGMGPGWILDLKRSPTDPNHLVALTSTQVVWLSVDADTGAHIILSSRHYRDQDDDSLKLQLLADKAVCVALLFSSVHGLVDSYRFTASVEETVAPILSKSSWNLSKSPNSTSEESHASHALNTLCILPCQFSVNGRNRGTGPGQLYYELDVRFYQIYSLDQKLGLSSTLSASIFSDPNNADGTPQPIIPVPPNVRMVNSIPQKSSRKVIEDSFVSQNAAVDSDMDDYMVEELDNLDINHPGVEKTNAKRLHSRTVNHSSLHELALMATPPGISRSLVNYSENLSQHLVSNHESGMSEAFTLLELASFDEVQIEDLDETSLVLGRIVNSLSTVEPRGTNMGRMFTTVSAPDVSTVLGHDNHSLELDVTNLYDHQVKVWVGGLPGNTPGVVRLARERRIRMIATWLYLSSQVFYPTSLVLDPQEANATLSIKDSSASRPAASSRRFTTPEASSGSLPTPRPTPSSEDGDLLSRKLQEMPAASHLRQYAKTVGYLPRLTKRQNRLLDDWPSIPGEDPGQYTWQPLGSNEADDGSRMSRKREKEEARRRRREERMLAKPSRATTVESFMSQPMPTLPWASQPAIHNVMSSQAVPDDIPMTQTEPGVFGGRSTGHPKKKKKRKVAGFR